MAISSIFLSGWEYSRVLSDNPFAPRNSALPAQVLWNGGSQFWLFEKVYCTKEALEGDVAAYERFNWTSGYIYSDLVRRGVIEAIDIAEHTNSDAILKREMTKVHGELRKQYTEEALMGLLARGESAQLEIINSVILSPLFDHLSCAKNVPPSSIAHWINDGERQFSEDVGRNELLRLLVEPLRRNVEKWPIGISLCNPPGTGLPNEVLQRQHEIEKTVQAPMIPSLLAGNLSVSEYLDELDRRGTADVYKPVNKQLRDDYDRQKGRLDKMREIAAKHLWPDLHGEWLPRLQEDPSFIDDFKRLLRVALLTSKLDEYESWTDWSISAIAEVGRYCAQLGADSKLKLIGDLVDKGLSRILTNEKSRALRGARPLIAFYQKLR